MEKVKVSKEVAVYIQQIEKLNLRTKELKKFFDNAPVFMPEKAKMTRAERKYQITNAIFNGYEVETTEEKWAKNIEDFKMLAASDDLREKCYGSEQLILLKKLKADGLIDLPGLD